MITFEPFHPQHIKYIAPNAVQIDEYALMQQDGVSDILTSGVALSAWVSGACIGAAGVVPHWPGRAEMWALISPRAGKYMLPCLRKTRFVLDTLPYRRIDMVVKVDNAEGHTIAHLLGFEYEAKLEAYHTDGSDMIMYVRIKRQWQ